MGCPSINNLTFSREGQSALKEVRKKLKMSNIMQVFLSGGSLLVALYETEAPYQMVNIKYTDWKLLGKVIGSIPDIAKHEIRKIAMTETLRAQGGEEYVFWQAMYDLCMFGE